MKQFCLSIVFCHHRRWLGVSQARRDRNGGSQEQTSASTPSPKFPLSPHYARATCSDRGYGRPSGPPRVFLRQSQDKLTLRRPDRYASAASPWGYSVTQPSPRFRYDVSYPMRVSDLNPKNSSILRSNHAKAHEQSKDAEDNPAPDQGHCRISHDIPSGESCQTKNRQSPERLNHIGPLVSPGHHHG